LQLMNFSLLGSSAMADPYQMDMDDLNTDSFSDGTRTRPSLPVAG